MKVATYRFAASVFLTVLLSLLAPRAFAETVVTIVNNTEYTITVIFFKNDDPDKILGHSEIAEIKPGQSKDQRAVPDPFFIKVFKKGFLGDPIASKSDVSANSKVTITKDLEFKIERRPKPPTRFVNNTGGTIFVRVYDNTDIILLGERKQFEIKNGQTQDYAESPGKFKIKVFDGNGREKRLRADLVDGSRITIDRDFGIKSEPQ